MRKDKSLLYLQDETAFSPWHFLKPRWPVCPCCHQNILSGVGEGWWQKSKGGNKKWHSFGLKGFHFSRISCFWKIILMSRYLHLYLCSTSFPPLPEDLLDNGEYCICYSQYGSKSSPPTDFNMFWLERLVRKRLGRLCWFGLNVAWRMIFFCWEYG